MNLIPRIQIAPKGFLMGFFLKTGFISILHILPEYSCVLYPMGDTSCYKGTKSIAAKKKFENTTSRIFHQEEECRKNGLHNATTGDPIVQVIDTTDAPKHFATTVQITSATGHWKNKCKMFSPSSQKKQLRSPCHFLLMTLSLVRIASLVISHMEILIFAEILPFQILLW
jgi:hypothetical protein